MTIETLPATFDGANLDIVIIGNERWAMAPQIGGALGFAAGGKAIQKIHSRRKAEFTSADTLVIELPDRLGRPQLTRLFSQTGIAKLAMFADTPRAVAFRDWAAKVLAAGGHSNATSAKAELAAVRAELDQLRAQRDRLAELALAADPELARLHRYIAMGHGKTELLLLMRWKSSETLHKHKRRLADMGLIAMAPRTPAQIAATRRMIASRRREVAHG